MNIVLLTTETPHHAYFARELVEGFGLGGIFLERRQAVPAFETAHPFEQKRDEYERDVLARDIVACAGLARTCQFQSFNDKEAVTALRALRPDVLLLFGSGKISADVRQCASIACLNLHGGSPEHYRGLDNHLWTIYHREFQHLMTTLHRVEERLDTGDIVFQEPLKLERSTELHELRSITTRVCVDLALRALQSLSGTGRLPSRPQSQIGRYYSFMPAALKDACITNLRHHLASR